MEKLKPSAPGRLRQRSGSLPCSGASLIGDGLYGIDIKETPSGPVMIEINDNPNIDVGYEDAIEKDRVYERIVDVFLRRVHAAAKALQLR